MFLNNDDAHANSVLFGLVRVCLFLFVLFDDDVVVVVWLFLFVSSNNVFFCSL